MEEIGEMQFVVDRKQQNKQEIRERASEQAGEEEVEMAR